MIESIVIRGAREHNLKNVGVEIPHGKLTVVTGVSGSGKSTLALDILYAEGQRRYIESLSTYAKQFLEKLARPDVDEVTGVSPSIAIEQKNTTRSSRSTVGTATEIYDYLRLLFARVGRIHCPRCRLEVKPMSPDEVISSILAEFAGATFLIVAPITTGKGERNDLVADLLNQGYRRFLVEGELVTATDPASVADGGVVEVVLDRVRLDPARRARLLESIETAYTMTGGYVRFLPCEGGNVRDFSDKLVCLQCGERFDRPSPLLFSFNTPYGACPHCRGFGNRMEFDERLIVPDPNRSLFGQAIEPFSTPSMEYWQGKLMKFCRKRGIPVDRPFQTLDPDEKRVILEGDEDFVGVIPVLEEMREKSYKKYARFFTRRYLSFKDCRHCGGGRLRKEAYNILLAGRSIREVAAMTPGEALAFLEGLHLDEREKVITKDIMLELRSRLEFMLDVGLYYLTLDRLTRTLSGGEAQRIGLANSLGANLVGVLYVLDEPSIGLHPCDTAKLVRVLHALRDRGNTVVVVEHDLDIISSADHLVDLGPGAGDQGGEVLYQGPLAKARSRRSRTLKYLRGGYPLRARAGKTRRPAGFVTLRGVSEHNLKNIDVSFPIRCLTVVTGVSGSGKSTLVCDVLYQALKIRAPGYTSSFRSLQGAEEVGRVALVDQSPIGKTPRSNPITYMRAFSHIREMFAAQKLAADRGYRSGRFSFNVPGGRCNRCQGMGCERIEMHFMADLFVTCAECGGRRFNSETLEVTYRGKNIAEVLELTVQQALIFFSHCKPLTEKLRVLVDVGLGYLRLGQPSTTLSGGESQRMKIARELAEEPGGGVFYLLDEPTTGLHVEDVETLVRVLHQLVDRGNTVVVIEHNPQVILQADYIVDLGPGGGEEGGEVVTCGTPRQVAACTRSRTGAVLKRLLGRRAKGAA